MTSKTPLYKVETCNSYPYTWIWNKKHYATQEEAQVAAAEASAGNWIVRIMGRSYSGKWVTIGREIYNGEVTIALAG